MDRMQQLLDAEQDRLTEAEECRETVLELQDEIKDLQRAAVWANKQAAAIREQIDALKIDPELPSAEVELLEELAACRSDRAQMHLFAR